MRDIPRDNLASLSAATEAETAAPATAEIPNPAAAHTDAELGAHGSGRGFTFVFLGTFLLLYGITLFINIQGNFLGLFPSTVNPSVWDRTWKTRRIADAVRNDRSPKVVVMGSSRMMQIQPPYLEAVANKGPAFNWAVSSGEPLDWLAQLRWALSHGAKPDMIIVGVDDFAFGTMYNRFQLQLATHWELFNKVPLGERLLIGRDVLLQINIDSTIQSAIVLNDPPKKRSRSIKKTDHFFIEDGYLIYRDKVLAREKGDYRLGRRITGQANAWLGNLMKEPDPIEVLSPDERKVELFRQFLDLARANGIQVKVLTPPLHPEFEKQALKPGMQEVRDRVSAMLAKMCAERQFTYNDFRKLESYGASTDEWWDAFHPTPENTRRMINVLFGLPPEKVVKEVTPDRKILDNLPKVTDLNTW